MSLSRHSDHYGATPLKRHLHRYRLDLDQSVPDPESDAGSGDQVARFANRLRHHQSLAEARGDREAMEARLGGRIERGEARIGERLDRAGQDRKNMEARLRGDTAAMEARILAAVQQRPDTEDPEA